ARERHEFLSLGYTLVHPELHRHLHGDLDRDRTGFRKEHAIAIAGDERCKPPRQRERLLVHQPAEHHMRHERELALDRLANVRMVVAVAGGPPRRDAVNELASVRDHDPAAMAPLHWQ